MPTFTQVGSEAQLHWADPTCLDPGWDKMSVLVRVLIQKPSIESCRVFIQETLGETTDSPTKLKCPEDWLSHRDKCFRVFEACEFVRTMVMPFREDRILG